MEVHLLMQPRARPYVCRLFGGGSRGLKRPKMLLVWRPASVEQDTIFPTGCYKSAEKPYENGIIGTVRGLALPPSEQLSERAAQF